MKRTPKAFTLLEIMIVIIIIGILVFVALPKFFNLTESSRGLEAIRSISTIRFSMERCYMATMDFSQCRLLTQTMTRTGENTLDIDDPASSPNSHFSYTAQETTGSGGQSYYVSAMRNAIDNGNIEAAVGMGYNCDIELIGVTPQCQNSTVGNNQITWIGTGAYKNVAPK